MNVIRTIAVDCFEDYFWLLSQFSLMLVFFSFHSWFTLTMYKTDAVFVQNRVHLIANAFYRADSQCLKSLIRRKRRKLWNRFWFLLWIFTRHFYTHSNEFLQPPEFPFRTRCANTMFTNFRPYIRCRLGEWKISCTLRIVEYKLLKSSCCFTAAAFNTHTRTQRKNAEKPTSTEIRFDPVDQFKRWYALGNIIFPLVRPIHTNTHTPKKKKWCEIFFCQKISDNFQSHRNRAILNEK